MIASNKCNMLRNLSECDHSQLVVLKNYYAFYFFYNIKRQHFYLIYLNVFARTIQLADLSNKNKQSMQVPKLASYLGSKPFTKRNKHRVFFYLQYIQKHFLILFSSFGIMAQYVLLPTTIVICPILACWVKFGKRGTFK